MSKVTMTSISPVNISFGSKLQPIKQNKTNRQDDCFVSFGKKSDPKEIEDSLIKKHIDDLEAAISENSDKSSSNKSEKAIKELENADLATKKKVLLFTYGKGKEHEGYTMFTRALARNKKSIVKALFDIAKSSNIDTETQKAFILSSFEKAIATNPKHLSNIERDVVLELTELTAELAPGMFATKDVHGRWRTEYRFQQAVKTAFLNSKELSQQKALYLADNYYSILSDWKDTDFIDTIKNCEGVNKDLIGRNYYNREPFEQYVLNNDYKPEPEPQKKKKMAEILSAVRKVPTKIGKSFKEHSPF